MYLARIYKKKKNDNTTCNVVLQKDFTCSYEYTYAIVYVF